MDQDKTTVMGGYGSSRTQEDPDATRRVAEGSDYGSPVSESSWNQATRVTDYSGLPQDPIPQPQQTTYMPRAAAQPRYDADSARYSSETYRNYQSIPQYEEPEKSSRSRGVIKKILIVLAVFFALSVVFSIVSGIINRGSLSSGDGATQTESAQTAQVDLSDIPGQYWSNAKKLLESRGADLSSAVVLTNDGSTPLIDSNWVVTSIYYNNDGKLEVQLSKKGSSNDTGESSNVIDDLANKAQELGSRAQEALSSLQNLQLGT